MKPKLFLLFLFYFFVILKIQGLTNIEDDDDDKTIRIGAILDLNSRMGKEQKTAMQIAVEKFNMADFKISIHFMSNNETPLKTAFAVEALIQEKKVRVIVIGIESWHTTALVGQVGVLTQVPILSLAANPPITSPFSSQQWPFLVKLSHNATQEIRNIASMVRSYHWRRVIVVYEDDSSSMCGNSGTITSLTEALQSIGSQIEDHLVLSPYESITNPRLSVQEEISKLVNKSRCYSRVFIVLRVTLPYVSLLFEEAKRIGLMRNDSAWIVTETIANFLPSFDKSNMLSMEGVIGIMNKFDNSSRDFQVFEAKFGIQFLQEYKNETYHEPSFQALLAYDVVATITKARHSLSSRSDNIGTSKNLLEEILQSNFTGLSGDILFNEGHNNLARNDSTRLVNIVSGNYKEVFDFTTQDIEDDGTAKTLASEVIWPGNSIGGITHPKGWVMPTNMKPMKIGVPVAHTYKNFIKYQERSTKYDGHNSSSEVSLSNHNEDFDGYCIGLFKEVLNHLGYELPFNFIPNKNSYDDLISGVHNKTYDAAVGDITILAQRSELVDFTLPFEESGLSIIVPVVEPYNSHGAWIFLKPFTSKMWLVTFFVFLYTMIIIWVLEHRKDNSEFTTGTLTNQLSTTAWFACNSLYFTQREEVRSKLARAVVIMWLVIVLILTTSYTANLTSMMTNERLNRTTIDIEMLRRTNAKVGYDNSSFVNNFLEDLYKIKTENIVGIKDGRFEDFHKEFQAGKISAAGFESSYAQLFVTQYCNQYIMTKPILRYGGFGFVFPKGSPVVGDVSQAILILIENGKMKKLQKKYLNIRSECGSTIDDTNNKSDGDQSTLSLKSFEILFYMSGATSTFCLLASCIQLYKKYRQGIRS